MTEIVDSENFFAPAPADLIDSLLGQYEYMRKKVERVADVMNGPDFEGALHYFAEYAGKNDRHLTANTVSTLFDKAGGVAHLNAAYWSKAMHMTDVLDVMPQARRDAWHKQIRNPLGQKSRDGRTWEIEPIPEFNDENVRGTILALLSQRQTFFAERVDGIFKSLSKTHITNAPEGFGKRMILAGVFNSYDMLEHSRAGTINDLRCIIAKFMGRDEPGYNATDSVLNFARRHKTGDWVTIDGGALRVRCYQVGTAHLEIHPDMAWRLNAVLAQLYPLAIPSQFRERPKKKLKDFVMLDRPLPFAVLNVIGQLEPAKDYNPNSGYRQSNWVKAPGFYDLRGNKQKHVQAEANRVLESIGGTLLENGYRWAFDYDPLLVVHEIVASGCIPDQKSHQYYPTPERLARIAVELAEIGLDDDCIEPSAGTGGIADLMPKDRTACVEISGLHCKVLEAKGHRWMQGDFLKMDFVDRFDKIIMNPPFSEGRWQAHTQHAAKMLRTGGRLVAILPSSAKNSFRLDGLDCKWRGPYENEFAGTSVSVVILVADKP